ncbi:flagellar biosynthesis protein [Pseudomonas sp.]|uniref:flagellar biosynthesis protein n=1 Tax=Pseudomonas sp. TaxID=306 RepID=UPI0026234F29|nr:flagellar biosynthesis protein [Pseudomonas sp.]
MMVRMVVGVAMLALLSGCALNRSQVEVDGNAGAVPTTASVNGKKVYITAVDERVFQSKPTTPDNPSVMFQQMEDKAITERVIARKRNTYGMHIGDVLLKPGHTVPGIVSDAVAAAYRQAGYQVVSEPGVQGATGVQVNIAQFWSWTVLRGVLDSVTYNRAVLNIKPADGPEYQVKTEVNKEFAIGSTDRWKVITEDGLKAVTQQTLKHLQQP